MSLGSPMEQTFSFEKTGSKKQGEDGGAGESSAHKGNVTTSPAERQAVVAEVVTGKDAKAAGCEGDKNKAAPVKKRRYMGKTAYGGDGRSKTKHDSEKGDGVMDSSVSAEANKAASEDVAGLAAANHEKGEATETVKDTGSNISPTQIKQTCFKHTMQFFNIRL